MQTLLLVRVILGILIQRSLARLLDDRCEMAEWNEMEWRISNGGNAEPEAAAWMAGVRNETQFLCGGTLIHKRCVLTAAHCIEGHGRLFVKLGAYNISLPAVEYRVSHAEIHRGYSKATFVHDIGLLKLPLDVVYTKHIYPICINLLPTTQTEAEDASTFDAYGWGKTQSGNMSEILQRVTLHRYDHSRCNKILYSPLTSNQICAGSSDRDTCYGDSGGPLITEINYNGIRRLTQLGLVSYGLKKCKGLGIYTDVLRYADWIEEKIKAPFPQDSWPPSSFATGISNPPSETVAFGADKFDRARLLVEPCGTAVSTRIMDGNNAEPEAAAWMAAVYNGAIVICGSTVIHRRYVLTSAACASIRYDLFVKLGAYDIRHPTMEYNVTKKIVHDKFDPINKTSDIGLLQLSGDIPFSRSVYPICIILNPEFKSKVENAYTFDAYGWGRMNNRFASNLLQRVTLDRFDHRKCRNFFGFPLISSQICAGASVGDTCRGDPGGPLTTNVFVNGLQRQTQFGVISGGRRNCYGIGIYTDVSSYSDWIEEKIKAPFPQDSWPPSSFAADISNPVSISPPSETVAFGAEKFDQARLLVEPCGTAVSTRIMNGNNAEPEAAAWMAAVCIRTDTLVCGSTVIHRRYVLTAAYCISYFSASDLFVKLGAYDIRNPTLEFNVTKKVMHDKFDREKDTNDIGLLQLSGDIPFSRSVYPICIILNPEVKSKVENAYTFVAYGWGAKRSQLLQKINLQLYDHIACRNITGFPLILSQICAGASVGATCIIDEGGPLTKSLLVNGLQRQTQFGVIGHRSSRCSRMGVYTDVASYADWIEEKIKSPSPQYSWLPSSFAAGFANAVSISPPSETVAFGSESFDGARLLVEPCGTAVGTRIESGNNAEPEAAAWMAAVHDGIYLRCGSTVIHRRFVLTSGFCIWAFSSYDLFVKLGAYDIRHPTKEFSVTKKIKHDKFDWENNTNDIGLLQLSGDIPFSRSVYPICIILNPEVKSQEENAYTFDAYGWGAKKDGHLLQKVTLQLFDNIMCMNVSGFPLISSQICAGVFCINDEGGPLTKSVLVNGLQRETQFGVIDHRSSRCSRMGVYTDVTSYVDWIVRNVRDHIIFY